MLKVWSDKELGRYQWLQALDDQARRIGCRDLIDLGRRAGLVGDAAGNSATGATPFLRIVAPYLVRITRASLDRRTGDLTVEVSRSHLLAGRSDIEVTLLEAEPPGSLRPPIAVPAGSSATTLAFHEVGKGHAELRLHDAVFDLYGKKQGLLPSRYRKSPRVALAEVVDDGLTGLLAEAQSLRGISFEQTVVRLLFLLGWAPASLKRNISQSAGLPDGIARFDILALDRRDSVLLAVECTSDWFGDDKLGKLVSRANALRDALQNMLSSDDVPRIQPLVVTSKPRSVAPPHLLQAARNHSVGIIAQEG